MMDATGEAMFEGLREEEIEGLRQKYGKNIFHSEKQRTLITILWDIVREPMFLLLLIACSLYFILGQTSEGFMMLVAMVVVSAISLYQELKSKVALEALRGFAEPTVTVVREGIEKRVASEDLVPGDVVQLEEGEKIPADAVVLRSADLSVNESILTGESFPVEKSEAEGKNTLYQGTLINSGACTAKITATGNNTALGKLGKTLAVASTPPTQLQIQINGFVKKLALFGFLGFAVVWALNFLHSGNVIQSLLLGLTLAMSAIPEEIPVAFSSFMALGAFYMAKRGMITRQPATIENLGAITVICFDKTGTLTQNKMEVRNIYDPVTQESQDLNQVGENSGVLFYGLLACEKNPFDSMEKAIHEAYKKTSDGQWLKDPNPMVHEYPLEGRPPMMTHVYNVAGRRLAAAKGAIERIVAACELREDEKNKVNAYAQSMARQGYRVLAVASATPGAGDFPQSQDDFDWKFEGVIALYDPPRANVPAVLADFYKAGINIKLVTGDYPETAMSIARQVGLKFNGRFLTGEDVMQMTGEDLCRELQEVNIFARMFPDAKLKVIEALKTNGEIAAMSGDGVNDGPALKSAHVGIAMGKRGTEIARQAASLVLTDDNLALIVEAVYQGRKIYNNLRKATRYIVSIHIPIILTASLPLLLGWKFTNIFTPIHVIFLELIMGPTCSIFFEREPVEENLMVQPSRKMKLNMFGQHELVISVIQGLAIAACLLGLNFYLMNEGYDLIYTRTVLFTTLLVSNIFLTLADRSFTDTMLTTLRYKNDLAYYISVASLFFLAVIHLVPQVRDLFGLIPISGAHGLLCLASGFAGVMWFELYKGMFRRQRLAYEA